MCCHLAYIIEMLSMLDDTYAFVTFESLQLQLHLQYLLEMQIYNKQKKT